jgi:hypothetical protein
MEAKIITNATRYLQMGFAANRKLSWDKWTGDVD